MLDLTALTANVRRVEIRSVNIDSSVINVFTNLLIKKHQLNLRRAKLTEQSEHVVSEKQTTIILSVDFITIFTTLSSLLTQFLHRLL